VRTTEPAQTGDSGGNAQIGCDGLGWLLPGKLGDIMAPDGFVRTKVFDGGQPMGDRSEKQRRKAALAAWKARQRAESRAQLPLPPDQLQQLFDWLDTELAEQDCDHTLRLVQAWCAQAGVEAGPVEAWLRANGGYCDCEALLNAEQAFQEACRDQSPSQGPRSQSIAPDEEQAEEEE